MLPNESYIKNELIYAAHLANKRYLRNAALNWQCNHEETKFSLQLNIFKAKTLHTKNYSSDFYTNSE